MNDIKICPECIMISEPTNLFYCPYCGFIESTFGKLAYSKSFLFGGLVILRLEVESAIAFTLPTFTLRDHLKDCFGWLCCESPHDRLHNMASNNNVFNRPDGGDTSRRLGCL